MSASRSFAGHPANNFDFVRLAAALLVLVSHQFVLTGRTEPTVLGVHSLGGVGLLIFFSISGYLINESWKHAPHVMPFVRSRFLRIWPALAVMTLLTVFVLGPMATSGSASSYFASPETFRFLGMVVLKVHDRLPGVFDGNPFPDAVNGSMWTIPLEVRWYGILMLLGLLRITQYRFVFLALATVYIAYMLTIYVPSAERRKWEWELGVYFVAGMLASDFKTAFLRYRVQAAVAAVALAGIAAGFDRPYAALAVLVPVATLVLGTASIWPLSRIGRYGDFSYGVYLYAFPVQQLLVQAGSARLPFGVGLALAMAVTLGLATLSWHLVEAPALRFKQRWRPDRHSEVVR